MKENVYAKKKHLIRLNKSKKAVSHAINSHFLTGKNPCVNQAQLLYFTYTHSRPSQKLTSSTVTCIEMNVI